MNINKVLQTYYYTHMPFIYYNLDNMPNLLFTKIYNNYWKLCHFDGTNINDINLNLNLDTDKYYHCQPTCYMTADGIYHVSFCIQLDGQIYMYYSESNDILNLNPILICNCACGHINKDYIVIGYLSQNIYVLKTPIDLYNKIHDSDFINKYIYKKNNILYEIKLNKYDNNLARINYIPGEPNKLLVSWAASHTMNHGSLLIDLVEQKGYDITTQTR